MVESREADFSVEAASPAAGRNQGLETVLPSTGMGGIDFLKDKPSSMTYGRRIALSLMKYTWYNPRACQNEEGNDERGDQPYKELRVE